MKIRQINACTPKFRRSVLRGYHSETLDIECGYPPRCLKPIAHPGWVAGNACGDARVIWCKNHVFWSKIVTFYDFLAFRGRRLSGNPSRPLAGVTGVSNKSKAFSRTFSGFIWVNLSDPNAIKVNLENGPRRGPFCWLCAIISIFDEKIDIFGKILKIQFSRKIEISNQFWWDWSMMVVMNNFFGFHAQNTPRNCSQVSYRAIWWPRNFEDGGSKILILNGARALPRAPGCARVIAIR